MTMAPLATFQLGKDTMKKTDAHNYAAMIFQAYFATKNQADQMALKPMMEAALAALAPLPEDVPVPSDAKAADHG
jgi:hypothetical protein